MKHVSWKLIALAAITSASLAHADKPKDYKDMAAACPKPPVLHDGSYIGVQAGYNSFRTRNYITVNGTDTYNSNSVAATNGWTMGALVGYGKTFRQWMYLGGEMYIDANTFDETYRITTTNTFVTTEFSGGPIFGISLLPGVKFTETTLAYVRLGWNRAVLKTVQTSSDFDTNNHSNNSSGYVYGVGLETLIATNYSLRGEFDHLYFSSYQTKAPCDCGARLNPTANQYMVSVIYHFD